MDGLMFPRLPDVPFVTPQESLKRSGSPTEPWMKLCVKNWISPEPTTTVKAGNANTASSRVNRWWRSCLPGGLSSMQDALPPPCPRLSGPLRVHPESSRPCPRTNFFQAYTSLPKGVEPTMIRSEVTFLCQPLHSSVCSLATWTL